MAEARDKWTSLPEFPIPAEYANAGDYLRALAQNKIDEMVKFGWSGVACHAQRLKEGSTANRRKSLCAAATRPNTAGRLGAPRCRAGTPPLPSRMRQGALQVISL